MEEHISSAFDSDLAELDAMLSSMAGMAVVQLRTVIDAIRHAPDSLDALIANDQKIDALEADINHKAAEVIATRSPLAKDLRVVLSTVKIAQMLERIGDYAKNIAKRGKHFAQEGSAAAVLAELDRIGGFADTMVVDAVDALKHGDAGKAIAVWEADVELDRLYNEIYKDIIAEMETGRINAVTGTHLQFALKNVERIGDYATGIAEQVYFRIHGEDIEKPRPKASTT